MNYNVKHNVKVTTVTDLLFLIVQTLHGIFLIQKEKFIEQKSIFPHFSSFNYILTSMNNKSQGKKNYTPKWELKSLKLCVDQLS